MQVHIVSIGNELLIGDTINSNAAWLGRVFNEEGLTVTHVHTVPDDLQKVKEVITSSLEEADLVVTTGGLGPTQDDLTKQAVTELYNCELTLDDEVLSFIKEVFKQRGLSFTESNYDQAKVPECCEVLFNKQGTAPGMWFERDEGILIVLPGVPFEMKYLVNTIVLPKLAARKEEFLKPETRYLITAGVGESTLSDDVLAELPSQLDKHTDVAFLPSVRGVKLRITARGETSDDAKNELNRITEFIKDKTGAFLVGEGRDLDLSEVVGNLLREHETTLATAESCTGGFIANEITNIPGCSHYLQGGVVAYSNEVKVKQLGVSTEALDKYGAVSKQVALQMAEGVAKNLDADIGISTTGIAGPTGGTKEKPVGTVWIGFWNRDQHFALHAQFTNDRLINKERSGAVALDTIRLVLLGSSETPYGLKKHTA